VQTNQSGASTKICAAKPVVRNLDFEGRILDGGTHEDP
jgi:hypothetical protein